MYFNELSENNITYSVDMIRLRCYISYTFFNELQFRFDNIYTKYIRKKYTSFRPFNFYYNYEIEIEEGKSFWFGFLHNTEGKSLNENKRYNFTIEFNPNKIKDEPCLLFLLSISNDWFLVSYDLAFDLKVSILDIIYDQHKRRKVNIISNGYDDKTIRIGSGDGKIKIYNKKKESDLSLPWDLTRVEVSRSVDVFPIADIKLLKFGEEFLPKLYLNKYLYSINDFKDKTLLAVLYAVQNDFPIKELSRVYKDKIKKLLEGGYRIQFNETLATQVLRKTLFHYFIKTVKFR